MSISISIIVPVFNAVATLRRTLDSIKEQTFLDIEILCVDDCSNDTSLQILEEYASDDSRFKIIRLSENSGVAAARNKGIANAAGKYLCFLDADDWWHPEKLAVQFNYMEANATELSYMSYRRVNERGLSINVITPPSYITYRKILFANHIGNLTAMVNRNLIHKHHIMFEKIGHEDYVFWLTILGHISQAVLIPSPTPLCFYMVRKRSLSSNKLKAAKWQWLIYRKRLGLSLVVSWKYFLGYMMASLLKRYF